MRALMSFIFISALFATQSFAQRDPSCVKLDRMGIVGKSIWEHTHRIRGAHQCESRKHIEADINNDGEKDIIVIYTIAGACYDYEDWPAGRCGNGYIEFLAVFLKRNGKYTEPIIQEVGGRGVRFINKISVKDRTIILDTLEYNDSDPICCPRKPARLMLKLKNNELVYY